MRTGSAPRSVHSGGPRGAWLLCTVACRRGGGGRARPRGQTRPLGPGNGAAGPRDAAAGAGASRTARLRRCSHRAEGLNSHGRGQSVADAENSERGLRV